MSCDHHPLTCRSCREARDPISFLNRDQPPVPENRATVALLQRMLDTQAKENRFLTEELARLRAENEGLKAKTTDVKKPKRRAKR